MTSHDAANGPVAYWTPDPRLAGYVSAYHRYRVVLPPGAVLRDVVFPSWMTIRIAIDDPAPWSLTLGPRETSPMPLAAVVGPTSYAGYCTATRGTLVGLGLLPAGWARLFGGDLSRYANRVVPLAALDRTADSLRAALAVSPHPAPVFDAWLLARLDASVEADPMVARIFALLDDPAITRIETMAERLDLSPRALVTLTRRNFGFTPKLLLRRGRFLRALSATLMAPTGDSAAVLEAAGYWDRSHFLRDCHAFLGCSVRDFLARRGPLNPIAMEARRDVIGAPV